MPLKVTNPLKIVSDTVLLSALAQAGIDKDYVEFYQDYAMPVIVDGKKEKGKSPYAKFYRDLKSGKRFMVASGLPMVDADGVKIEAGWRIAGLNYFAEKNNLFRAKVQGTQVEVTIRNDQPDGRKAGDKLTFKPQLFLDGLEQSCGQSVLLPIDPINPNYLENTLEWDYGICKRRLRIIEGSLLGSWVFAQKPIGTVRIKYNQTGDYKLRLGQLSVSEDEEQITPAQFDELAKEQGGYPVIVSDSATFYPDANPESTSVDGYATHGAALSWANLRNAAGDGADDSAVDYPVVYISSTSTNNVWYRISRGIFLFDTSGLPDAATIFAATFSIYGGATKSDGQGWAQNIQLYSSAPASNTALGAGDYDSIGPLGAEVAFSTAIAYANWLTNAQSPYWNDFSLNVQGIAAIDKTGITKFGTRNANYDVANSAPAWASEKVSNITGYRSEQGVGYKPKLVVTYTTATTWEGSATLTGVGTLAGIGVGTFIGQSTLSGIGNLAGIGRLIATGKATLTGVGTLAGIGRGIFIGKSTLSGTGTLSGIGRCIFIGITTLSGVGTLIVSALSTFGKRRYGNNFPDETEIRTTKPTGSGRYG